MWRLVPQLCRRFEDGQSVSEEEFYIESWMELAWEQVHACKVWPIQVKEGISNVVSMGFIMLVICLSVASSFSRREGSFV